jgi:hypothetical protein
MLGDGDAALVEIDSGDSQSGVGRTEVESEKTETATDFNRPSLGREILPDLREKAGLDDPEA